MKRALITHSQTIQFIIQIIKVQVMALIHDVTRLIQLFIHVAPSGKMQTIFFLTGNLEEEGNGV